MANIRYVAPLLTAAYLMVGCGPSNVPVTARDCGVDAIELFDAPMGMKTLAYDHNGDGVMDEALRVAIAKRSPVTADVLSALPAKSWQHYLAAGTQESSACWSTGRARELTSHVLSGIDQLLQRGE